jgi:DNA replication protein DnaC
MLVNQTVEKLRAMRLNGLAEGFLRQMSQIGIQDISFDDRLAMLVEDEWMARLNRKQARLLREARFRDTACLEDIDYSHRRNLDKSMISRLANGTWLREHQNLIISGPTGVGKTYLACALGNLACRLHHQARYYRMPRLLSEIVLSHANGSYINLLDSLRKVRLLILDDWGLAPLTEIESREILEVIDDRVGTASTIIAGQIHPKHWHEVMSDPTVADAVIDRLIHNSHIIEIQGDSMRKHKNRLQTPKA